MLNFETVAKEAYAHNKPTSGWALDFNKLITVKDLNHELCHHQR